MARCTARLVLIKCLPIVTYTPYVCNITSIIKPGYQNGDMSDSCGCCIERSNRSESRRTGGSYAGRSPGELHLFREDFCFRVLGSGTPVPLDSSLQIAPETKLFLLQLRRALLIAHRTAASCDLPQLLLFLHIPQDPPT